MQPDPAAPRIFSDDPDQLGESPFWRAHDATLWWVDIAGRALRARGLDGRERRWDCDEEPGCIAPAPEGRILVALRSRLALFDPRDGSMQTLCTVPFDTATTRCNDGRCDPRGRFWVGTVFEPRTGPEAALYCLRHSPTGAWQLQQELGGAVTANGLAFSPDGTRAWWTNTPDHLIRSFAFDLQGGRFGAASEFARFPRKGEAARYGGRPDGVAIDSQGAYWVAMYEGGRVLRFAPDGTLLLDLEVPVVAPTMVCLGGPALRTLFITSAYKGRPAGELAAHPASGHVLAIELDDLGLGAEVCGLPAAVFDPQA